MMKRFLGILVMGLILVGNAYSETKFSEIKKTLKEDNYGLAIPQSFHALISPKAKNPVSVSDFSIIGKTSIRFESNHGECGEEPKHSDCEMIEKEQNFIIKKNLRKKKYGIDFIFIYPKITIQSLLQRCL
jgi:hypothetical protein